MKLIKNDMCLLLIDEEVEIKGTQGYYAKPLLCAVKFRNKWI